MSSKHHQTEQSIDLPTTETFPKPVPTVGHVYRAEPGGNIDNACVGSIARFPTGTVAVQSFDDVRYDAPGAGDIAFFDDVDAALDEFEETFSDADVWFDWETL